MSDVQGEPKGQTEKKERKKRVQRPFPACSFGEAKELADAIHTYGSGQPVRRLSLFDHIEKSPESGPSRQWITNASKYGLIAGSYKAEQLALTPDGAKAVDPDVPKRERTRASVKLAIEGVDVFRGLFERFAGNKLPARAALVDAARDLDVPESLAEEAVDTFVVNLRDLGLLQTLSGAERIVTVEHLLDTLPSAPPPVLEPSEREPRKSSQSVDVQQVDLSRTCFYVAPIGGDDSEERMHSDLFLGSLVEPALDVFELTVVRADAIDKPGMITRQVIDYLLRARLVIADLSFHNPNVFYELAIRHAARLPVVQIIRSADTVPFDLNQIRTVRIDTSNIYSLVPRIDTYRSEIGNQVRRALEDADSVDNPISTYYPTFRALFSVDGELSGNTDAPPE